MDSEFMKMLDQFDCDDPLLLQDDTEHELEHEEELEEEQYDDQLSSINIDESLKKKRKLLKKAPDAPKRFKSAYICYVMEKVDEVKQANPDDLKITDTMKKLATMWKNLSPADREVYETKAKDDKSRYYQEMKYYTGPMHVPNKRKKKPHGAPKRAMSAFLSFSQQMRPIVREQYPALKNTDISTMLAKKWHELSEEDKKPYLERELLEREKYHKDMATWKENSTSCAKADSEYIPPYIPKSDTNTHNNSNVVTTDFIDSVMKIKPSNDSIRPIWSSLHHTGNRDDDIFLMFDTDASITYFGDTSTAGGASITSSKNQSASKYPLSSAFDNVKSNKLSSATSNQQQNLSRGNFGATSSNPVLNEANGMYADTIEKFPIGSSERGMKKLSAITQQGECWPFNISETKNDVSCDADNSTANEYAANDSDKLTAVIPVQTTSSIGAPLFNLKETLIAVKNASKQEDGRPSAEAKTSIGDVTGASNQALSYSFGTQFDLYYKTLATYNDNRNKSNESAE